MHICMKASRSSSPSAGRATQAVRMTLVGLLLSTLPQQTCAAYVQVQDCYDQLSRSGGDGVSPLPRLHLEGLTASLDVHEGAAAAQLRLNLTGSRPGQKTCDFQLAPRTPGSLQVAAMGGFESYENTAVNVSCRASGSAESERALITHAFDYKIASPKTLDSLDVSLQLRDANGLSYACAKAHVTPSLNRSLADAALYAPIAVFLVVLAVALWHESSDMASLSDSVLQIGPLMREPTRSHLTRIAECLSYLQHVFFSAALSLDYPGFLRPVAAKASWSTLMIPRGPILTTSPYYGVRDGIYEVNGTFGGTNGLELMTQVMGAPVTMRTWANVASLSLILLATLAALVQLGYRLPLTSGFLRGESARRLRGTADYGLRGTAWTVLRVFLTYFLAPITAWTTYQFTFAAFLPAYQVAVAAVVVALLAAALWWGIVQNSPRNLGYLLIDASPKHLLQTPGILSRSQDRYAMAAFALMFVRGAAAGGLQVAGLAQLLALAACEVVQLLVAGFTWRVFPLARVAGLLTAAKLLVYFLCIAFLPGIAGHYARAVVGLVILVIHAVVLVVMFLLPSLFGAGALLAHSVSKVLDAKQIDGGEGLEQYRLDQLPLPRQINARRASSRLSFDEADLGPRNPSSLLVSPTASIRARPGHDDAGSYVYSHRRGISFSSSSDGSRPSVDDVGLGKAEERPDGHEGAGGEADHDCPGPAPRHLIHD
ncbi:Putative transient receptor potential channel Flc/Pkd2 [Colletotrichum destructivum]|uniref:Transient receptor potential channel Flc/Pkd2 n=1 Tax=Colletotrichum destructivum TaxID=34406 RepID=A0AAX4IH34_9PEZI|nr:Putative transient receptor potential channel Flc/Pkd2 [Colletotrichum destructivum]